ncbi:hypothetical protein Clacol_005014 [Clathrus columnatus]|uniref:F-box domain-containing protein n=1 Tax=Clathrus columnatus TaxID=1419009 RepID=A0AAV5A828_9AGAM|nr:hypothetical protein Clacol_005014 [Clathrus columnatus]
MFKRQRPLMSLKEMSEKQEISGKHLVSLNGSHNSKSPANKMVLDIFYQIFTLAVFGAALPGTTALIISHVCQSWRKTALEIPILWGFLDVGSEQLSTLFLKRSKNAPIIMSWSDSHSLFKPPVSRYFGIYYSARAQYFASCVCLLPRLNTLYLHITFALFEKIRSLFENSKQLQLKILDMGVYHSHETNLSDPNTIRLETPLTNTDCLHELRLRNLFLPWAIQSHQKLIRLSIREPRFLPNPAYLLTFLSHCPALVELEIILWDRPWDTTRQAVLNMPTALDFYHLVSLKLAAEGIESYECVREVSSRIRVHQRLTSFKMRYTDVPLTQAMYQPTNIFALAPTGIVSHFEEEDFLSIFLDLGTNCFVINAGRAGSELETPRIGKSTPFTTIPSSFPFLLVGVGRLDLPFDHFAVIDLICKMPEVRYLRLISSAWELLTSRKIDLSSMLPHLGTLELYDSVRFPQYRDCTDVLITLRGSGIRLRTLILKNVQFDSSVLLGVAFTTGIKTLELPHCPVVPNDFRALRESGIQVVAADNTPCFDISHLAIDSNSNNSLLSPLCL